MSGRNSLLWACSDTSTSSLCWGPHIPGANWCTHTFSRQFRSQNTAQPGHLLISAPPRGGSCCLQHEFIFAGASLRSFAQDRCPLGAVPAHGALAVPVTQSTHPRVASAGPFISRTRQSFSKVRKLNLTTPLQNRSGLGTPRSN